MEKYKNINGDSGVDSYEIGNNFIRVKFKRKSKIYQYSYNKAGESNVENMKQKAIQGAGLNTYINRYVKNLYD